MFDTEDVGVFLGLDVGKSAHHGRGLTPAGKKVLDKQLPNSEPRLRAVFDKLTAKFGVASRTLALIVTGGTGSVRILTAAGRPRARSPRLRV